MFPRSLTRIAGPESASNHSPGVWIPVTVGVSAVLLTACGTTSGDPRPAAGAAGTVADPGFGHVHGLDVNPGEDAVYAATHTGVWRLPVAREAAGATEIWKSKEPPERIADRQQDTMGFTIAGTDRFYASGHPDFTEQPELTPPLLGLIVSTDRAVTWTPVALRAEVDFHDIEVDATGRRIVGYSATNGRVLISADAGSSWEPGASAELRDLALDPVAPDVILATAREGLLRSSDGGRTFSPVEGAPALVLLDWTYTERPSGEALWGVDINGTVWEAPTADPAAWERRGGLPAVPEAFTAHLSGSETLLLAADERGVITSADAGRAWAVLTPDLPATPMEPVDGDHGGHT